jgi:translation initiation factor IF-1
MPKNKTGGNKAKKQGNKNMNRKILIADALDDGQLFAQITKKLGDQRYYVLCSDNIERIGKSCNKLNRSSRGENRLDVGSNVVVSLRVDCDSTKMKCDLLAFADPPDDVLKLFKSKLSENTDDTDVIQFDIVKEEILDEDNENIDFDDI